MPKIRERICSSVSSSCSCSFDAVAAAEEAPVTGGDVDEANEREGQGNEEERGDGGGDDDDAIDKGEDDADVDATPPRADTKSEPVAAAIEDENVHTLRCIVRLLLLLLHAPRPLKTRARPCREAIFSFSTKTKKRRRKK